MPLLMPGAKRGIKYPWAYMLLGQLVAVSFSTGLFITALSVRPRTRQITNDRVWLLLSPLFGAMFTIYRHPDVVGTNGFMPNLLAMHALLLLPLFFSPKTIPNLPESQGPVGLTLAETVGYLGLSTTAFAIHKLNLDSFAKSLGRRPLLQTLGRTIFVHPAQGSISFDVIFVLLTLAFWFLTTGSWTSLFFKSVVLGTGVAGAWISKTGVNWTLVMSIVPIGLLLSVGISGLLLGQLRKNNEVKRKALLEKMGIVEENVIPGTDKTPPSYAPRRIIVGFWHPYW